MAKPTPEPPVVTEPPEGPDPVEQTMALIQPWIDFVPRPQRRLGLFIALALAVHLSAFYFVTIISTRAELSRQPRTHVTIENTRTTTLAGVTTDSLPDRMADPRLYILPPTTREALAPDAPPFDFDAMNGNLSTRDLPEAALPTDFQFVRPVNPPLEQRVSEALQPTRQPFVYQEPPLKVASKTTWQWDRALAERRPRVLPELPSPLSDTDLNPTHIRLAVDASGTVVTALVEGSPLLGPGGGSGRLDLDQLAVLAARKIRFRSVDVPGLTWGRATIFWRYSAKPREEVVPTPPSGP